MSACDRCFAPLEPVYDVRSTAGVFGETAAGVTLGALRAAVAAGEVGPCDRVVLFVTGDGLKTRAPVVDRLRPFEVEPDADAVLDALRVAA